jgi:hypothetical protein
MMLRALLATIFAVLTASAASAVERSPVPAADHFAAKFDPSPAHQGEDQIDIDKQPCVSPQDWSGKSAVNEHLASFRGPRGPVAKVFSQPQRLSQHDLFLYACAPRAPPVPGRA